MAIDDKVAYKKGFEAFCESGPDYPDMYNLTNYRISKLSMKHITRIYAFRDRILYYITNESF